MRNQLVVLVLTFVLAVTLSAGDKADFSGSWAFSEEKSTLDDMGTRFVQTKMKVTQGDNEMTVTKTFVGMNGEDVEGEEKLTLDGKENKSEIWGGSPRVSTATWNENGDTLNIATTITFERDGQTSTMDADEAWSLGEDGKTLSLKHSSSSDWGERNITMVFTKMEEE